MDAKGVILAKVRRIQEANPMIGLRACRVGVLYPEIYETQVAQYMMQLASSRRRVTQPPRDNDPWNNHVEGDHLPEALR